MNPCKNHVGCANPGGYGVIRHNGKAELSHRVAYCEFHGLPIASIRGKVIRHACDNRLCIEPSHLLIGTQYDNVQDMLNRKRNSPPPRRSGDQHHSAKLSYAEVKEIRANVAAGVKQTDLARRFGVSAAAINSIVKNRTWDEYVCEVNARIAPLSITADGLAKLGFQSVGTERAAKLYRASDLTAICQTLVDHLVHVLSQKEAA